MTPIALRKSKDDHSHAAKDLSRALAAKVRGEVRFDGGTRAMYSTDASNYRQVPMGVVLPRDNEDVVAAVAVCRAFGVPVLSRGGGTSLAGQTCNVAVVIDFSKYMRRVLEIDPDEKIARVQPGVVLDDLRKQAEQVHLTLPPDPATHEWNTLGGMLGNNSCGIHSVMGGLHGRTSDYVEELLVLTYGGEMMRVGRTSDDELLQIIRNGGRRGAMYSKLRALRDRHAERIRERYPKIPRRVSGYNLDDLLPENGFHVGRALVGSEGTCVTILEAKMRLVPSPPKRVLLVLGYEHVYASADHVGEVLEAKPVGLEGMDRKLVEFLSRKQIRKEEVALLPGGEGWLIVEFGGDTQEEARDQAQVLMARLERNGSAPQMRLLEDAAEQKMVWDIRESGLSATAHVPGMRDTWPGWEDAAVPPENLGQYLRAFRGLLDEFGYDCALYGHFGQGCIHCRIDFDLKSRAGIDRYLAFVDRAADLVVRLGGSLSGEHGDGQARAMLLEKMVGPELIEAFREFKSIWDPDWKMNPGKVVDAWRIDENLRLGAGYAPLSVRTHFQFPQDGGNFAEATLRCVGVGKCRRTEGGTMCPSYMVTLEEKHTTRGRARMLFEMLNGEETARGWDNADVKDALDLCLVCKGCKGDCPVHVDIATYKAEFLSHYYEHHRRPMSAIAMGLIRIWARIASFVPRLANAVFRLPILGALLKKLGGITTRREMPQFADQTFKRWFFGRDNSKKNGKPVILWADTFNDHFHPDVAKAAVHVLEASGHRVLVPRASLCCGRPLYDYGMLDRAKRTLEEILSVLRPAIRAGIPVVGLEPSCISVFRDELVELFPHDEDARRLSASSFLLSEFLHDAGWEPPPLERKAVVHGHCHQKSVLRFEAATALLEKAKLDCEVIDSGCCGLAGSFGYETEHYEISRAIGERALLPAVRKADDGALVVTEGFSCRQQIEDFTGRRALHIAEVLEMALRERDWAEARAGANMAKPRRAKKTRVLPAIASIALGVAAGVGIEWTRRALRV